jgi:predicted 3-demethylubiquinone-9 3-methyltransferase (glyoxalase superfamily)
MEEPMSHQTITTFLWFNGNAEEAVELYTSIFPKSRVTKVARWGEGGPAPAGSVMTIAFELDGQGFLALNGGPEFPFTPAISLLITCPTQADVDDNWARLTAGGGKPGRCGWLTDRFGVSWQVVPEGLGDLMSDPDPKAAGRVARALMTMEKIDIERLRQARAAA